jgi:hypothetical protein
MGIPQDWAPYSSVDEAARVYLRDPELALDQIRSVIDLSAIKSFNMARGSTEESWGEASPCPEGGRCPRWQKSATETDIYCESFRYHKSVDNGGLAQMQRLLQFGRVLSRCMQ